MAAVRRGAVDLNLLTIDDQAVAFTYNYHYRGYCLWPADGRSHGAGGVLLCGRRRQLRRGDRIYDLGRTIWIANASGGPGCADHRYRISWQSPRAEPCGWEDGFRDAW
jgi:hypothetical protein